MSRKELYICLLATLLLVLGLASGVCFGSGHAEVGAACAILAFLAFIGIAIVDERS